MSSPTTSSWNSDKGYIWSLLGSAIGFANILGFGSQCYRNGGTAFLIPFFAALFMLGIPMLILEGILGQKTKKPLISTYGYFLGKRWKFFGWLAVCAVTTIGAFYIVLTGWAIAYTFYAAIGGIPQDSVTFFTKTFLNSTGNIFDRGETSWPIIASTVAVSIFSWYVLSKNIRTGIEKWCSFFLPLLVGLIALFSITVSFLPGAVDGFWLYIRPDLSKLADFTIWRDVFGQLFFSLSLGLGIVVGYSCYTKESTDIQKAMFQVALGDFAISFMSGFIIFGCMGYLANNTGSSFEKIVSTHSTFEIGYIIFPTIFHTFGSVGGKILGTVFFFSVFIAGITGVFSIIESIVGNIQSEFQTARSRAVAATMIIITLLTIPFCMGNGTAIIGALEPMVMGNNMLIGGIVQIVAFMFLTPQIRDHEVWWTADNKRRLSYYALKYPSLAILTITLSIILMQDFMEGLTISVIIRWGWFVGASILSIALSSAVPNPRPVTPSFSQNMGQARREAAKDLPSLNT
jgi:neurotransmitter:Na+ symporter, NSS family